MTREEYMKRTEIFEGLVALYEQMTGHKFEVIITDAVIWTGNDALRFKSMDKVVDYMTSEIAKYVKGE